MKRYTFSSRSLLNREPNATLLTREVCKMHRSSNRAQQRKLWKELTNNENMVIMQSWFRYFIRITPNNKLTPEFMGLFVDTLPVSDLSLITAIGLPCDYLQNRNHNQYRHCSDYVWSKNTSTATCTPHLQGCMLIRQYSQQSHDAQSGSNLQRIG